MGSPLQFLCLIQTHSDASTAPATKLLEAGVDPNEGFEFQYFEAQPATPLQCAAANNNGDTGTALIQTPLRHGANINLVRGEARNMSSCSGFIPLRGSVRFFCWEVAQISTLLVQNTDLFLLTAGYARAKDIMRICIENGLGLSEFVDDSDDRISGISPDQAWEQMSGEAQVPVVEGYHSFFCVPAR